MYAVMLNLYYNSQSTLGTKTTLKKNPQRVLVKAIVFIRSLRCSSVVCFDKKFEINKNISIQKPIFSVT